jgi:hypothetical protein
MTSVDDIDRRRVDALARGALNPGELILWTGYCQSRLGKQRKAGKHRDVALILFGFFTLVSAVAVLSYIGSPGSQLKALILIPYLLVLALVAMFLARLPDGTMYCRQQMIYVLTNERVFIVRNCNEGVPVRSLPLRFIDQVRAERVMPDGRGTVEFLCQDPSTRRSASAMRFFRVGRVQAVVAEIESARAKTARDAASGPAA